MGTSARRRAAPRLIARTALTAAAAVTLGVCLPAPGAATGRLTTGPLTTGPLALAASSSGLSQDFAELRACESSGNYQADTGNSYYGAYQFSQATWRSLGYTGLPSAASPAVQDAAAAALQAQAGWSPWPACANRLGLLPAATTAPPGPGLAFVSALAADTTGNQLPTTDARTLAAEIDAGTLTRAAETAVMVHTSGYAARQVTAAYHQVLGRGVDPVGLATWSKALETGTSPAALAADLTGSAEFYQNAGDTAEGFVAAVYQHLLDRPADPGGLAAWTEALVHGMPRDGLALALLGSAEGRADQVQADYQSVLRRPADPSGLITWSGVLARNGDDTTGLTAGLLASEEYFADAQDR